jgi:hemerythrin-like domain-containing protein
MRDEPLLMVKSLDLQLQHRFTWIVRAMADGAWRVEVGRRSDSTPRDIFDLLGREHQWVDDELAKILLLLNQGESVESLSRLRYFGAALRRHIAAEDEILAPYFAAVHNSGSADPAAIMLREHQDILSQLKLVEDALVEMAPDAGEAGIYAAILSGTLAKHEYREENNLFPRWRAALAGKSAGDRDQLMVEVRQALLRES